MHRPAGVHHVVVLALPPAVGYDLAIPPMAFGEAVGPDGQRLYRVTVASLDGQAVPTVTGYGVIPAADQGALANADTVVLPGTRYPGPRTQGRLPGELADALALVPEHARWVSICTGAFVLAATGRLDGRRATTHWRYVEAFRALYPRVRVDENALFVDEGDVLTSAGLSAGVDLCLHLLRADHGSEVANAVARYCVVPPWREGGQAQFIERQVPPSDAMSTAAAREWALRRLAEPIDLATWARAAHLSLRTFTRRFREETGQSPSQWLNQQRVRHAQHLLESTDLPVDRVALEAGLGTGTSLRTHLRQTAGVSPGAYRRTFRGA